MKIKWNFGDKPETHPHGYSDTVLVACKYGGGQFVDTDRWHSVRKDWERFEEGHPLKVVAWARTPEFPSEAHCSEETSEFLAIGPTTSGKVSIGFEGEGMPFKRCSIGESKQIIELIEDAISQASRIKL